MCAGRVAGLGTGIDTALKIAELESRRDLLRDELGSETIGRLNSTLSGLDSSNEVPDRATIRAAEAEARRLEREMDRRLQTDELTKAPIHLLAKAAGCELDEDSVSSAGGRAQARLKVRDGRTLPVRVEAERTGAPTRIAVEVAGADIHKVASRNGETLFGCEAEAEYVRGLVEASGCGGVVEPTDSSGFGQRFEIQSREAWQ